MFLVPVGADRYELYCEVPDEPLDADDEPRELGAEIDYYSALAPAYAPKNGPLETVEELLLVRGVTPQLLFGADINRNGQLDPHEQTDDSTSAADYRDIALRHRQGRSGWSTASSESSGHDAPDWGAIDLQDFKREFQD